MDYSKFKFPAYEHHDYPKWVGDVIVNSREEEDALAPKAEPEHVKRAYIRKDK